MSKKECRAFCCLIRRRRTSWRHNNATSKQLAERDRTQLPIPLHTTMIPLLCLLPIAAAFPFRFPNTQTTFPVRAIGILRDFSDGDAPAVEGVIIFTQYQSDEPVVVSGEITGLSPGLHGFHIHQLGNLTEGCKSAGSHFNPDGTSHGGPTHFYRHAGDLGNIRANEDGVSTLYVTDNKLSLVGRNSIIGRSVVVHAKPDDLGLGGDEESLRTGNAGGRVACAVIGLAQEHTPSNAFNPFMWPREAMEERSGPLPPQFGGPYQANPFAQQTYNPQQSFNPFAYSPFTSSPLLSPRNYGNPFNNFWGFKK